MLPDLIRRCRRGDDEAARLLVERFRNRALAQAFAILRDADLAEDAVQEAFAAALASLESLQNSEAFPSWFRRIVRTHAIRILRRRREIPAAMDEQAIATGGRIEPMFASPSAGEAPARRIEREEESRRIREAIRALPEAQREAATLFYLDEMSCAQAAETLRIPAGTLKRRLHDARRRLRSILLGSLESPAPARPPGRSRRTGPRI